VKHEGEVSVSDVMFVPCFVKICPLGTLLGWHIPKLTAPTCDYMDVMFP